MLFIKLSPLIALFLLGCKYEIFVSPFNRIGHVFSIVFSCIPVFGIIYVLALLCVFLLNYQCPAYVDYVNGKPVYEASNCDQYIYVRDTKLNRWLFNELDWECVDARIKHSIEEQMDKKEEKLRKEQENHE